MSAMTILDRPAGPDAAYDADFYEWALTQAEVIRSRKFGDLDIANLAEEIESLGKEQFSKIRSAFRVILLHMLKWDHQPERRSRSWVNSIRDKRLRLDDIFDDSPSLRRRRLEGVEKAYRRARIQAAEETGSQQSRFPIECPYSLDDILARPFEWTDE